MKAPRVTLDQWRTLQAVVDQGGYAQAAEMLHRSQSSVSYAVARLQEQLGMQLLRIDGRKAVLTEAGTVLLRRSRQLVKQAGQLEDPVTRCSANASTQCRHSCGRTGLTPSTCSAR